MSSDMLDVSSVHLIHQIVSYAVSPRHFQTFPDHWCMHIICDGAADFYVSGGSYTAYAGDILLFPPGLCHAILPENSTLRMTILFFTGACVPDSSQDCRLYSMRSSPTILSFLQIMQQSATLPVARDKLLEALLLQLAALPGLSLSPLHPSSPSSLILAYLNTHFQEDISLSSLSEQFHLTPSHIIHIFKPLYELSPIQYLNHRRIGEAQYLLETTKHSAGAIAGMVGIYNRNYFYSTFKKMVGMSPSDYRRICAF
ncbi:MAG: helix-turn-helix transcriptional regulator [Clostridiaceae bacterium]|nr:helix-turn-helix transcriptional regulator [Clostridiaceae bacterium]